MGVVRSVLIALVSTILVVGVGLMVTMGGGALPGVSPLTDEQRVSGAVAAPAATPTSPVTTEEAPATDATSPADKALGALVHSVEKQVTRDAAKPRRTSSPARVSAAPARRLARAAETPTTTSYGFRIASFNILGSNHTAPGGDAKGWAPGRIRAEWAGRLVADRGVDIVGWGEIQRDQYDAVLRSTGGAFEMWPGTALGSKGIPASLMWRTSQFSAVWKGTVTIPFVGQQRPMPIVQLQDVATGRQFFVMNIHNAPQGRESERNVAEARELDLIRTIRRESGLPVLLTGDFNEKAEIFCSVTGTTDLHAAAGGSNNGACRPPGGMRVDWIFGSPEVGFSGYVADRGAGVGRITDHHVLFSDVTVN